MRMNVRELRRVGLGVVWLGAALVLQGCGERSGPSSFLEIPGEIAMRAAEVGSSKADVLNLLPQGPIDQEGVSSLRGYPLDRYLIEGSWVEVLWLIPLEGEPETLPYRQTRTPVIFRDEFFDGWGWDHFATRGGDWGLAEPARPEPTQVPDTSEGDAGQGGESDTPPTPTREGQSTTDEDASASS
jgi:hypothetical protein